MTYSELINQVKSLGFKIPMGASDSWEPSLSEFINACGKDFRLLLRIPEENSEPVIWSVSSKKEGVLDEIGLSAEEAVAKLWISLNKK